MEYLGFGLGDGSTSMGFRWKYMGGVEMEVHREVRWKYTGGDEREEEWES